MVSIVIGRGGNQIKQLQSRTYTEVFVSSAKLARGTMRSAQIKGECTATFLPHRKDGKRGRSVQKDVRIDRGPRSLRRGQREGQRTRTLPRQHQD